MAAVLLHQWDWPGPPRGRVGTVPECQLRPSDAEDPCRGWASSSSAPFLLLAALYGGISRPHYQANWRCRSPSSFVKRHHRGTKPHEADLLVEHEKGDHCGGSEWCVAITAVDFQGRTRGAQFTGSSRRQVDACLFHLRAHRGSVKSLWYSIFAAARGLLIGPLMWSALGCKSRSQVLMNLNFKMWPINSMTSFGFFKKPRECLWGTQLPVW